MKLSILICTIERRSVKFERLVNLLQPQLTEEVEAKSCCDRGIMKIGTKRNKLLESALGDYVCFIDDDDRISPDYVKLLLEAIKTNPDCVSLNGLMTVNGKHPKKFIHSIKYNRYFEKNGVYYRPPNHLNCIKTSIAKKFIFPEINSSEDTNWAMQIVDSGLLKTEAEIKEIIYFYDYISRK